MRSSVLATLLFLLSFKSYVIAQESESNPKDDSTCKLQCWIGEWRGEAINEVAGKGKQKFSVQLSVSPGKSPNRWDWVITYAGSAGKSVRNYELVAVDESKGLYMLDEKNGIELPATMFDDSLHFHFTVSDQILWSRYRLIDKDGAKNDETKIEFELITASAQSVKTTGTPDLKVTGLQPVSRQFATLKLARKSAD